MDTPLAEFASMLGLTQNDGLSPAPDQIMNKIREGLPVASLYRVSGQIAPGDNQFVFRIVPKASLARRKTKHKPLSSEQSDRLARLVSVWSIAHAIWRDADQVREFLRRPHLMLGDRRPLDCVLESEVGADLVKSILGRLVHGTAA